jgi:hypothetical protein
MRPTTHVHDLRPAYAFVLGLVLLASPLISYMRSEEIGNSRYSVKSERLLVVPRPLAVLIVVAGAVALILSRKDRAAS